MLTMGKGACITLDPTVLVPGPHSTTKRTNHGEKTVYQHNAGASLQDQSKHTLAPQIEKDANLQGDFHSQEADSTRIAVEFMDKAVDFYETGNVTKAQDAIEVAIKNLQELKSFKLSLLSAREIYFLDRGRNASVVCVKTSFELSGLTLLNQPISADSDCLADIANISGALAFRFCKLDLAEKAFLLSEAYVLTRHGSAVAKNNIGCVSFFDGDFKKAHEAFQLSLISFQKIYKDDGSDGNAKMIAEKYIIAVQNNISLVFQAQRNYQSALLARSCLMETVTNEKLNFPFQTVLAVMYNQASLCLELRNYREAVRHLEDTVSFCHKAHVADEELLEFLLLKIGAVTLLIGRTTREAEMAGEKVFSSSEAKELFTSRRSSSNLFLQSVEILLDILIQQSKLEVATTFLADFVPICKQIFGSQHPRAASILFRHGYVLHLIGKGIHAKVCYTESLEILTGVYGFIHPEVLKCQVALARLASHEGCYEESLLRSQRSLELLDDIYQVSCEGALKEKLIELLQSKRSAVVQAENEEETRIKSLINEYGPELLTVFHAETGSVDHLNEDRVPADEIQVFLRPSQVSISKEISRKLTYDFLKNGLCLFRHGMVTHSTAFLQLALSYCEDFHQNSVHSDICLLRAILVFPSRRRNVVEMTGQLGEILTFTKRSIEHCNQQRQDEKENCLFFDDQLNFKVTLAMLLPSMAELKMASEMSLAQDLYAELFDHFGSKTLNISLGELYCSFFQTHIDCLGSTISHELISLTMAGGGILEPFPKCKTHPQTEICSTMALSRKSALANRSIASPHCFIFFCRTSVAVDIDILKDIYQKTVRSAQERISMLTSLDENHAGGTKHFIELKPIARVDNDVALIAGDLDLVPLCLERCCKQRKSQSQSQLIDFLSTQRICEALTSFEFHDPSTSRLLFRKLIPNVIQNQRHLGGVQVLTMSENLWTLCILNPMKARITLMCNESCIRVQIQLVSSEDGSDCQVCIRGSSPCNCEIIERFFMDEMDECASLFDVHYKIVKEKARCISNMTLSSVHVENKANEMPALRGKEPFMNKLPQQGYASSLRWLGKRGRRSDKQGVETGTLHYQPARSTFQQPNDWPIGALLPSELHKESCIDEKTLLRETFTQTDSLSLPLENEKPETAESETQTKVLDFLDCLEKEIGDGVRGRIPGIDTRSCLASSSAPLDPSGKDDPLCLGYSLAGHHLLVMDAKEELAKEELETQELGRLLFELTKQSRNIIKSCCSLQLEKTRCGRVIQQRPGIEFSINNVWRHDERKNEVRHTKSEQSANEPISGTACDSSNTHFPLGTSEEMDLNVIASTNGKEEGEARTAKERDRTVGLDNGVSETFSVMPITVTDRSFIKAQVESDNDVGMFNTEEFPFRTRSLKDDPRGWIDTADILPCNPINMNIEVSFQTTLSTKKHSDLGIYDNKHAKSTSRVEGNDEVDNRNGESMQVRQQDIWFASDGRELEQELDSFIASRGQVSEEGQNLKQQMECGASGSKSYRHDIEADESTACPSLIANRNFSFANKARAVETPCKQATATLHPTNKPSNGLNRDHYDKDTDNIAKLIQLPDTKNIVMATRGEKRLEQADGSREETKTLYNDCLQQGARPKDSRNPSNEVHQTTPIATNKSSGELKVSPQLGLSPCFLARHIGGDDVHVSMPLQTELWPDPVSFNNSCSLPSGFRHLTSPASDTVCSESTSSFPYTFGNGVDECLISEGHHPQRPRHSQECMVLAAPINLSPYQVSGEHQLHGGLPPLYNSCSEWTLNTNSPQSVLEGTNHFLPTPPSTCPQRSLNLTTTSFLMGPNCSSPCSMLGSTHAQPLISGDDTGYTSTVRRSSFLHDIPEDSVTVPQMRPSSVHDGFNQIRNQRDIRGSWETSKNDEYLLPKSESFIVPREDKAISKIVTADNATQTTATDSNSNGSDEFSLAALEQRVAEACALVERVLKEREELERAEREEKERKKQEEQERNKREPRKRMERDRNEGRRATPLQDTPRWLCEHYQRRCRVKFPCCGRFYPCHRCHNSAGTCDNDDCKAKEATHTECSVCKHQQEISQDAQTCARCGTVMAAYFCFTCKHFTGVDKNPYHCEKCGICRIHKDRSFHCKICDVCLDKRLLGNHKCRPDSGHDECCICLEDAFSGCQILPCSHKVHKDCAMAMIRNGIHKCPICRHPLYSSTTNPGQRN